MKKNWVGWLAGTAIISGLFICSGQAQAEQAERNEYLIGFNTEVGEEEFEEVKQANGEVEHEFEYMSVLEVTLPKQAANALENNPNIEFIEENEEMETLEQQIPWGLDRLEAPDVHGDGISGNGVKVAVLDSGIDGNHEDLHVAGGVSFVDSEPDPQTDRNGHGTHVAGTIASLDNNTGVLGMSPQAELYAVKVLGADGSGDFSSIAQGLEWSIDNNMDIVNMSLGGTMGSQALEEASDNAYEAGITVIAAAGNSGSLGFFNTINYPAKYDSVMAVGAVDENDNRASFSSVGEELEVMAPGVNVLSTTPNDNYEAFDGTSMASPHVAGAASLMLDNDPSLSSEEIRQKLNATADPLGDSFYYGNGIVNLKAALQ
ncbi:S8 family peptidase [Alteribacillus sp. JSM 102045]|uniref:S8 family peptidase n=1 Tax=Alteribacillus sp. JSM 102045 TaxID=1562101 RepID=UPI0035C027D1